jgi:hypothetical protein
MRVYAPLFDPGTAVLTDERRIASGVVAYNVSGVTAVITVLDTLEPSMRENKISIANQGAPGLRKRHPYNEPLPFTMRWAATLPIECRPIALLRKYPRIANLLARDWNDPLECQRYLDELLIDRRGGRRGFPADVHGDLLALRDFYRDRHINLPTAGNGAPGGTSDPISH